MSEPQTEAGKRLIALGLNSLADDIVAIEAESAALVRERLVDKAGRLKDRGTLTDEEYGAALGLLLIRDADDMTDEEKQHLRERALQLIAEGKIPAPGDPA